MAHFESSTQVVSAIMWCTASPTLPSGLALSWALWRFMGLLGFGHRYKRTLYTKVFIAAVVSHCLVMVMVDIIHYMKLYDTVLYCTELYCTVLY